MNTSSLKKFAQIARNLLLEDVSKRFLYWGFDKRGRVLHELEATSGGYLFRGYAYNDTSIPAKWNALVSAVGRHTVNDIIEEAAYTWFNRLMAIKILEQNGYDQPVLAYAAADLQEPVILRNAKKGIYPTSNPQEIQALKRKLMGANDDEALAALLVSYCRNHRLLNRIFGHLDDYTELLIPGALLAKGGILELINDDSLISEGEYQEVELIGWLYQFYISDKKDDVFASFKKKKKARAEDIPAATQIFTPKWIVKYLVENTVGRLWLDLHPESPIRETMKYLVEPENHTPDEPIIKDVTELKVLDPAVGSGHFLVVAFDLLMQMYLEEGYSKRKAVEAIIEQNLYGLDICPRAAGLANFAILLKAAQYHGEVLRENHYPQVYAMPESFDFSRNQVETFLGSGGSDSVDEVHAAFKTLKQGKNIGSALILNLSDEAKAELQNAINQNEQVSLDLSGLMNLKRMLPFARVASLLTDQFPSVVTNPPYMGSRNMNTKMAKYIKSNYPLSKSDLFSVIVEVALKRCSSSGLVGMITMQSWMFLNSYQKLRENLLLNHQLISMVHLGAGGFINVTAFNVLTTAFVLSVNTRKKNYEAVFIDLTKKYDSQEKRTHFFIASRKPVSQDLFLQVDGTPLIYQISRNAVNVLINSKALKDLVEPRQGMATTDNKRFVRRWSEVIFSDIGFNLTNRTDALLSEIKWFPYNKSGNFRKWYGNSDHIVNYQYDGKELKSVVQNKYRNTSYAKDFSKEKWDKLIDVWVLKNKEYYFKEGITWSSFGFDNMGTRYTPHGYIFDVGGSSAFPEKKDMYFLLGLLSSCVAFFFISRLNPTVNFQNGDIAKIPIIIPPNDVLIKRIDRLVQENINLSKLDWDSKEYSWDFEGHLICNSCPSLKYAYGEWERKYVANFFKLHQNEEELNSIFINIYGLEGELTPEVPLKDITILQDECDRNQLEKNDVEFRVAKRLPIKKDIVINNLLSYAVGCFMGRYRLDKPGLKIAHPNPTTDEISSYTYNGHTFDIDDDAIIPIMGSESPFSDDIVQRVQQFVLMVWGEKSYTENLNFINEALGEDLEKFLTRKFWDFHKKMYKKRPIYWQFASPKGAFKVLTYMHRMNRFTVQKIRQNYLFKQINYLESEITRLAADEVSLNSTEARKLDRFRSNLLECRDYDLLLKDVADRQIEFDLDDGVLENYKLFEGVVSKI